MQMGPVGNQESVQNCAEAPSPITIRTETDALNMLSTLRSGLDGSDAQ